jgi:hypothetical protein
MRLNVAAMKQLPFRQYINFLEHDPQQGDDAPCPSVENGATLVGPGASTANCIIYEEILPKAYVPIASISWMKSV